MTTNSLRQNLYQMLVSHKLRSSSKPLKRILPLHSINLYAGNVTEYGEKKIQSRVVHHVETIPCIVGLHKVDCYI